MKRIGLIFVGLVGLLLAIALVRTLMISAPDTSTADTSDQIEVDALAVANRLGEAIRFQTLSTQTDREANRAPFVAFAQWMETTYPAFHTVASREVIGGYSLFYTWPGSDPALEPILLMSHIDVVPIAPGTEQHWEEDPFSGKVADGFIWGRGTIDSKGSLVAILEAAEYLVARGYSPRRTIHFSFGHDEEVSGKGADAISKILEARGIKPYAVIDEGGAILTGMAGVPGQVASIGVAEKGYLTLKLTATARGGHSSTPPEYTAIGGLAKAITKIEASPFKNGRDARPECRSSSAWLLRTFGCLGRLLKRNCAA